MGSNIELAVVYAALILADDNIDITSDKLQALTKAAGVDVEPVWANLFAKALEGKNVTDLLFNVGAGGGGAPATGGTGGGSATSGAADAKPAEEEKPKEEEQDESDGDMGLGLFD